VKQDRNDEDGDSAGRFGARSGSRNDRDVGSPPPPERSPAARLTLVRTEVRPIGSKDDYFGAAISVARAPFTDAGTSNRIGFAARMWSPRVTNRSQSRFSPVRATAWWIVP